MMKAVTNCLFNYNAGNNYNKNNISQNQLNNYISIFSE